VPDESALKPVSQTRLLIVEDDPRLRELLVRMTGEWGFMTSASWSGEEAARMNDQTPFDLAILDYHLPRMNGMQTLRRLRDSAPDLQAVVLTAHANLDLAREAMHLDVVEFLVKPCQRGELEKALDRALRRGRNAEPSPLDVPKSAPGNSLRPVQTIEDAERDLILQSLQRNNGNRAAAARELGITRRTLHNKINTYQSQGFAIP
jgi:DNA-binding NtrC family response regulator